MLIKQPNNTTGGRRCRDLLAGPLLPEGTSAVKILVGKYMDYMQAWECTILEGDLKNRSMFIDLNVSGELSFDDTKEGMIVDVDEITPFSYIADGVRVRLSRRPDRKGNHGTSNA